MRHQLAVWSAAAVTVFLMCQSLDGTIQLAVAALGVLWLVIPHQRLAAAAASAAIVVVLLDRQWGQCGERYEQLVAFRLAAALAVVEATGVWIKRSPTRAALARTRAALVVLAGAAIARGLALLPVMDTAQHGGFLVELVTRHRVAEANVGAPLDDSLPVWLATLVGFPMLVSAGVATVAGALLLGPVAITARRWPLAMAVVMVLVTRAAAWIWSVVGGDPADLGAETVLWLTWGVIVAAAVRRDIRYPAPPV